MIRQYGLFAVLVGASSLVLAAGGHKAHVHGAAELTLALEGNEVELRLESPANNIVGFEHRASTDAQMQTVEKAEKTLSSSSLFSFTGSSCELEHAKVDMSGVEKEDAYHDGHHAHEDDHHGHEDDHHDHHDDHDKHHDDDHADHDDHKGEVHSEIVAEYHYSCKDTADVASVSVNVFEHFPAVEKLKVQWISDAKQGSAVLRASSNTVTLK